MKNSKTIALIFCTSLWIFSCGKKENQEDRQNIDSSVVGKDTNQASIRNDIEMSDENKQAVPGMTGDSAKSDQVIKKKRGDETTSDETRSDNPAKKE